MPSAELCSVIFVGFNVVFDTGESNVNTTTPAFMSKVKLRKFGAAVDATKPPTVSAAAFVAKTGVIGL